MKKLKSKIKKNGYLLKQVIRTEGVALYSVFFKDRCIGYEAIKVRELPYPLSNETYEKYPSNKEFGTYGWSYNYYEDALIKYNDLVKSSKKSKKNK